MNRMVLVLVLGMTGFSVFPVMAQGAGEIRIVEITSPPLDVFEEAKVTPPFESFEPQDVTLPLIVQEVSRNNMLKVTVNGVTGWVLPTFVRVEGLDPTRVEASCAPERSETRLAATRSLGEGCD